MLGLSLRGQPMKRRQFITLIGGAAAGWPVTAFTQSARKAALIGWLSGAPLTATTSTRMFLQGLQDLGYVEARDFQMTYRSSDGYQDRLPALAEELVRLNPDVLVAAGLEAVVALRNVTQTIPIVSATLADAVRLGLIANEARPTGNRQSTATVLMSPPAGSPATVWISSGAGAVPHLSWIRFCTAHDRAIFRSSFRPRCCCRSTSKRPRRSASPCHRLCSCGPTR